MSNSEQSSLDDYTGEVVAPLEWPLLTRVGVELAADASAARCRALREESRVELLQKFTDGESVEALVRAGASFVDALLLNLWQLRLDAGLRQRLCLVAVGGYGRGELHPWSDIDIMVLTPAPLTDHERGQVEQLLTFLWDTGLEVGSSVRTVAECAQECAADVTVMTALLEARALSGDEALLQQMRAALSPEHIWPVQKFFEAKLREQQDRHLKANDTGFNLEPNIKSSPGGLRDIQTIGWVAKRHFGADSFDELVGKGFISAGELRRLKQAQSFLWKARFGLHALAGRKEDRLLFDYQQKLAASFGYEDATYTLAVEQLMQRYYRTVIDVKLLNEVLLQSFREVILSENAPPTPLTARFQIRDQTLEAINDDVFTRHPSALLELFVLLQHNPQLRGVRASTIRAITRNLWLIDEEFRQMPRNHRLFMEILRAPRGVTHELRRMNDYGVLGRYIPAFGRIVGRMQFDLFHAYTVDAHTLFVVSNSRRLAMPQYDHEVPHASQVMQLLPRPELVYLGALFHDIAKGRGGDHSTLGAVDAESFCLEQGMGTYDARLVAWLVQSHLVFSTTAQKQDISDPQVLAEFARFVGDEAHLDYLYVLTCADVRGTNPKLWNSWKSSLFQDFYEKVKRALRRGLERPVDQEEQVRENRFAARRLLLESGVASDDVERVFERLSANYFLRYAPEDIARHAQVLASRAAVTEETVVSVAAQTERGSTAVMIYAPKRQHGFARATAVLDQLGLTIVDAQITPLDNGFSLDTYHVLEDDGTAISDSDRIEEIERSLHGSLREPDGSPASVSRRASRQSRVFNTALQISLNVDERNNRTVLELTAGDRPGLLCDIGKVLWEEGAELQAAKIATFGERAEDVFYLTSSGGRALDEAAAGKLRARLFDTLKPQRAA
jgi:[protein-PII] uridylyltransferase